MKIAIIGAGDMGRLHARAFAKRHEVICFSPSKKTRARLVREFSAIKSITVANDIESAAMGKDMIILLPPVDAIDIVVRSIKGSIGEGATVIAGTSVMLPAAEALLKRLAGKNVNIVGMHCLFGPREGLDFRRNAIAAVRIRTTDKAFEDSKVLFRSSFKTGPGSIRIVDIRPKGVKNPNGTRASDEHDRIMAETQVVTHVGFQSMGTAWMRVGIFPWNNDVYRDSIDHAKTLMMLRIFHGKTHMYESIAMQNCHAQRQAEQYARSVNELLGMMKSGDERGFRARLEKARSFLRANHMVHMPKGVTGVLELKGSISMPSKPNSHLSLMAMADSWRVLNTDMHTDIMFSTPPFLIRRLIVGMAFEDSVFEESVQAALNSNEVMEHDRVFAGSVEDWTRAIVRKNRRAYEMLFGRTREFFGDQLDKGMAESDRLINGVAGAMNMADAKRHEKVFS